MSEECLTVHSKIPPTALTVVDDFLDPPIPEEELDRIDKMRDKTKPGRYNWALKEDLPKAPCRLVWNATI